MRIKLFAGLIILFIALTLQFWFASAGWYVDLSYAALISFAFVFGFWELLLFIALAVFVVNWQPAASMEIILFAAFPIAVHLSRNVLHWQVWLENVLAIFVGFFLLYLAVSRVGFNWQSFFIDVIAGSVFGTLLVWPLYRWGRE